MIEIRPATGADAPALAELRWEFRVGRDPAVEDRDAFLKRCTDWMRRELDAGTWLAWIASSDGRAVGQVWLHTWTKVPNPIGERERHAYLSNFYIVPAERGGVGSRMLETVLDWSASNGIDRVLLWPTARSVRLYQRHGFVREGDVMELKCADWAASRR